MNGNFLTVTLCSYFKDMSSGCETFLPVFLIPHDRMSKFTFTEPKHVLLVFALYITTAEDVRRKDRQYGIYRFVFGSTLNSDTLDQNLR